MREQFDSTMRLLIMTVGGLIGLLTCTSQIAWGQSVTGREVSCIDGQAEGFSCRNVDLISYLHYSDIGGTAVFTDVVSDIVLNDVWGWTDPETGKEYALVGRVDATAFVDISDPVNPVYLGELPAHDEQPTTWRDFKVYANHVFIVAESAEHGMQIFDLKQLRNMGTVPVRFTETAHYDGIAAAHNIAINEETGFAYILGANAGGTTCGGGLHMVNVQQPTNPVFAGCFADPETGVTSTGYTHDAQCVIYRGLDNEHLGKEICIASNETALSIVDVTNKTNPTVISRAHHPTFAYVHQGWLTETHAYFLLDDEVDERRPSRNDPDAKTRTFIWDLQDLDDPVLVTIHDGVSTSIDHNQYIVGRYAFQANYTSGLRILDINDIANPVEVGFFDTFIRNDAVSDPETGFVLFRGAWSNYPFFKSGVVIVSSVGEGLFILKPTSLVQTARETTEALETFQLSPSYPNPFDQSTTIGLTVDRSQHIRVMVHDLLGQPIRLLYDGLLEPGKDHRFTLNAHGLAAGVYFVHAVGEETTFSTRVVLLR